MVEVEKYGVAVPVASRLIQDMPRLDNYMRRHDEFMALPPEERRRISEGARLKAQEERIAVRRAQTVYPKTPMEAWDIFAERMGWPVGYLAHLAQPYCTCDSDRDDGWVFCEHARDLWPVLRHE